MNSRKRCKWDVQYCDDCGDCNTPQKVYHLSLQPGLDIRGVRASGGGFWAFLAEPAPGLWEACANAMGWCRHSRRGQDHRRHEGVGA